MLSIKRLFSVFRRHSKEDIHRECVFFYFLHANEIAARRRKAGVAISADVTPEELAEIIVGARDHLIAKYRISPGDAGRIAKNAFQTFTEMQPKQQ